MDKDWFGFTLQERRGIAVFIILCSIVYCIGAFWPQKRFEEKDLSKYYNDSDSTNLEEEASNQSFSEMMWAEEKSKKVIRQEFQFDPNNISADSLMLLGFSKFGSRSLANFISKGGRIYDENKFKSIFGIDTLLVNDLKNNISYPERVVNSYQKPNKEDTQKFEEKKAEIIVVELNSADSLSLDAIKGVGPYMVKRILQFRKRLGGYLYKEQLTELGIIADSLYQPISDKITADPAKIIKINLNTADYKAFTANPYFSKETTTAIIKYRNQHGPFQDILHISRIRSLKEEIGLKILPYLKVE